MITQYAAKQERKLWQGIVAGEFMDHSHWRNPIHILKDRFEAFGDWESIVEQTWAIWQGLALLALCLLSGCASPQPRWIGSPFMSIPDQNGHFVQGYLPQIQLGIWRGQVYYREVPYTPPPDPALKKETKP